MTTEYKSIEFQLLRVTDGKWEWTIPKLRISGRHPDEHRAVADARASIDHWLERLH